MQNIKAVILDIDGTLSKINSWVFLTENLGADLQPLFKCLFDLRAKTISAQEADDFVVKLWTNTGNATRKNIISIYNKIEFKSESLAIYKYLKSKYKVCLISGNTNLHAESVSKKLSQKDFYWNTKMSFDENDILNGLDYHVNQSEKKLVQFTEWSQKNSIKAEECAIIGDSETDQSLLENLGLPILLLTQFTPEYLKQRVQIKIDVITQVMDYL